MATEGSLKSLNLYFGTVCLIFVPCYGEQEQYYGDQLSYKECDFLISPKVVRATVHYFLHPSIFKLNLTLLPPDTAGTPLPVSLNYHLLYPLRVLLQSDTLYLLTLQPYTLSLKLPIKNSSVRSPYYPQGLSIH